MRDLLIYRRLKRGRRQLVYNISGMATLPFVSAACASCDVVCSKNQEWGRDLHVLRCNMGEKNWTLWLGMEILKWRNAENVKRPLLKEKRGCGNTLLQCKHKDEGNLFQYEMVIHK